MTEAEMLAKMVAPGTRRPGKFRDGVIQIHVTRACDKACFACTQGSNLGGKTGFMTPEQFRTAVESLKGYFGVVGVFGGNPALSPHFAAYCEILRELVPFPQRGLWCNHPKGKGVEMAKTFNPAVSNLNVHLDREAYAEFKRDWPASAPFGLDRDSRHSPPFVAMRDVLRKECNNCDGTGECSGSSGGAWACTECGGSGQVYDEDKARELISGCDINQHWSAMIGIFRGELRAWFCEIAGAQAMLHQDEPDYPDTGLQIAPGDWDGWSEWWRLPMSNFRDQVAKHCHDCGVPLRGKGELSQAADGTEKVSAVHEGVYRPKRVGRRVELVTTTAQLNGSCGRVIDYLKNGG